ncbi:MAG: hypothetical protein WCS74_00445 [Dehalococcoidales bacterium]|nr:carboxypeptidase-like regulatory domain-containing protein [Limnochordia bacterium]MDD2252468.1 hypothetical protein [Dehalococcoidales bacterium]MDD3265187.1 hypothetical protein [Dehalococcoidales bacterium]MDD4322248.1 hypothetical protein [Dehalococcoidales bacterium]MDD4794426.1 hypothetical protein [Dehalococcoidales bacterium]
MKRIIKAILPLLVIAGLFATSCTLGNPSYLEGKLTILPEPGEGESPALVYSACQVMVYDTQTGKLSHVLGIDDSGYYSTKIRPGSYVIDLYRMGAIGKTNDVPNVVQVESGQTLVLDIDLDTRR